METKPYSLQAPEDIAKEYGGNKQKIAQAVQMGIVNPTAALLAGMFIDRMRNAAPAEQAPTQTVAEEVFNPQPAPSMPAQGLAAMRQPQMPQGMPPQGMPPQGTPPQGLAAMQQPQMPSMASGGVIGYAEGRGVNSGNPFEEFPDLYESRNKFDYEIEALKNQLRNTETDDRRGLAERLKQITMGDPAVLPKLSDDPSLIELGERNRDLLALKERARQRKDEGVLSPEEYEALQLEEYIPNNEYMARSSIRDLEQEIAEREAERQAAVAPDNSEMLEREIIQLDENGEVPGGLQSVIDFAPVPGEESLGLQSEGNIGLQAPELQQEPGTLLDPQSYPGAPEAPETSRSEQTYADLQAMLTGVDKDSEMTAEAVQARADKEKREDTLTALAEFGFRMAASDSPYFLQAAGEAGAGTAPTFKDAISRSRTTVEDARKERALVDANARAERIEILKDSLNYLQGEDKVKAEKELKREEFALREKLKDKDVGIANIYADAQDKESFSERQFKDTLALVKKENPELSESQQRTIATQILKGKTGDVTYEDFQPTYLANLEAETSLRDATIKAITGEQMGREVLNEYNKLAIDPAKQRDFVTKQMEIRSPEAMENFRAIKRKNQKLMGIDPPPSDSGGGKPGGKPGGESDTTPVVEGFEQGNFKGIPNAAWGTLDQNKNNPSAIKAFAKKFGIEESDVLSALEEWQATMDDLPN